MPKMILKNVRLSFPSLFKKAVFDNVETKFEATLLLDKVKHAKEIAMIEKTIDDFLVEKFGAGKVPKSIKLTCLVDGDTKEYDGYAGMMAFKAGTTRRPTVIDRNKTPLVESDGKPYAGCYVNASVDIWFSDHPKGGKQVLGNLYGVQFAADGEAFGAGGDASDDFDAYEDDLDL